MTILIAINDYCPPQIHRYETDDPVEAMSQFLRDWIAGDVSWDVSAYYGPNCTVDNPAFTPEFLESLLDDYDTYKVKNGVYIWTWWCITGIHGSDEHYVSAYVIPQVVDQVYETI